MENYIIALGSYMVLWIALKLFINYKDKRNGKKKTNAQRGRKDYSHVTKTEWDIIQRSGFGVQPPNEYEAISIEEGIYAPVPTEVWLAQHEHETFMEYLRYNLGEQGILMDDIDI